MEQYIPWIISGVCMIVSILSFIRSGRKDIRQDTREDTARFDGIKESLIKVNMKLDQVCATTNETRTDIKTLNKDLQGIETRVSVLERDLKTAFNVIDDLKKVNRQ